MSSSFSGRQHTEESKRKIRLANLKKKVPPEAFELLASDPGLKWCPACEQVLNVDCFTTAPSKSTGLWQYCRDCNKIKVREYAKTPAGQAAQRRRSIRYRYGLEPEDFDRLLSEHPACAICRRPWDEQVRPRVDHCHLSGRNRALLCDGCNTGLGLFGEDATRLESAIEYVKKYR